METLYDLLGALPDDDADSLRAAFRHAVKGSPPDIHPGDPYAGLKFRKIVRASEILLAGRKINGTEAAAWGLANDVASPVLPAALEAAASLAVQPPQAVRTAKALLHSEELTIAGRMAEEMTLFIEALGGTEFKEVIAARSEKRPPVF